MRSSLLDECFDGHEEQEFLGELVEAALHEAHETLAAHKEDSGSVDTPDEINLYLENIQRQQRKIKFLDHLYECLAPEGR